MAWEGKSGTAPAVIVKKIIPAAPEAVFDAWTKPELMQKWFYPGKWTAKTTNELRVGGSYSHNMIATSGEPGCSENEKAKPGEERHNLVTGEYLEIQRPEKLVFTWSSPQVKNTKVTVEFRDLGDSTEVKITHELLQNEEERQNHSKGWEGCVSNLATFLG